MSSSAVDKAVLGLNITGLLVTIIGLLILACFSAGFLGSQSNNTNVLINIGQVYKYFEQSNVAITKAVYSNNAQTDEYLSAKASLQTLMQTIVTQVETSISNKFNTTVVRYFDELNVQNSQMLLMVQFGQQDSAIAKLNSAAYKTVSAAFGAGVVDLSTSIQENEKRNKNSFVAMNIVQLIIAITLAIILVSLIPVIVFGFRKKSSSV